MSIEIFYSNNRILIEILFLVILAIFTLYLTYKTFRVYNFSKYLPIKYFSISFTLYLFGFISRFFRLYLENTNYKELYFLTAFGEQYLTSIAGFYLLFSLIYKNYSKIFNHLIALSFHFLFLLLSVVSVYTQIRYFTFVPLIIIFTYTSIITYQNIQNSISKLFFITMILNLIGWISYMISWAYLVQTSDNLYGTIFMLTNILTISILIILTFIIKKSLKRF